MMCCSISFWVYHLIQQTCHDCWAKGRCDCQEMYGHGLDSDALVFTLYTFVSVNWFMDLDLGWFSMSSFIYGPFFGCKNPWGTSRLFDVESPPKWDMSSYVTCCTCFVNGYGFRKGVGTQKTQGVHHQWKEEFESLFGYICDYKYYTVTWGW